MKRALVVIALVTPAAAFVTNQGTAPKPPVIAPRITELGTILDTTPIFSESPHEAALSPQGNLVAYVADGGLRIWDSRTRRRITLVSSSVYSMGWSPAGDVLAFARPDEQGTGSFVWTQRVNPNTGQAVGNAQRVSLSATTTYTAQFSPDGKFLAFPRRDQGRRSSLVVVPVTGGPERVLASDFGIRRIRWTKGGLLYYVSTDSMGRSPRVFRVASTGGEARLVFDVPADWPFPMIMADGRLAFYRSAVNEDVITITDSSGKALATLPSPPNAWGAGFAGPYQMTAVREEHPRGLRITDLSNGSSRFLIDTTAEVSSPTWFKDGKRLAVLAKFSGSHQLVTMSPDGSGMRKYALTTRPLMPRFLLTWYQADLRISPDGRYASYLSDDRVSLELVDLSSGATRTLIRPRISASTPFWSSDSRTIRYIRDGAVNTPNTTRALHEVTVDGVDKLIRALPFAEFSGGGTPLLDYNTLVAFGAGTTDYKLVPVDGAPARVLVQQPTWGGEVSPDGQVIALRVGFSNNAAPPQRQLSFVSMANGARRDITLPLPVHNASFQQFHPDGKHIFVAGRESNTGPVVFHSVPVDGSAPREVARTHTRDAISVFSVSPDAKYIAYIVAAAPRFTFLGLDYTAGISRLTASSTNR